MATMLRIDLQQQLTQAVDLLHGQEKVVSADAGYQGIASRAEMEGKGIGFRVAMRPGKRRALPDTPEGRVDDLIETAIAAGFCLQ